MFRGASKLSLDAKGRMAVPARHRDPIAKLCDGQLVVTVDRDGCLLIYPQPTWNVIQEELVALPNLDIEARNIKRLMIGYADDQELDSAGRIRISKELRDFAQLDRKVMLIGQGNKFELWDEERWTNGCDDWRKTAADGGARSDALASLSW